MNSKPTTALILAALLAGCGGGSSSSGGGQSITNVAPAPKSYVTAAGAQVHETTRIRPIRGTTCADLLAADVTAEARYTIRWSPDSVTVNVKFDYPVWTPEGSPNPALVSEWDRYISALEVHENGHRDIGIRRAERILNDLPRAQQIFEAGVQLDAQYDQQTNGGATQGARLNC